MIDVLWAGFWIGIAMIGSAVPVYRWARGRHRGRLPDAIVAELVHHKLACRGEHPSRVSLEMRILLGEAPVIIRGAAPTP